MERDSLLLPIGESIVVDHFEHGQDTYQIWTTVESRPRWYVTLNNDLFCIGWSRTAIRSIFNFSRQFTDMAAEDELIMSHLAKRRASLKQEAEARQDAFVKEFLG